MAADAAAALVTECKQIQEDATYTAEAHYVIARSLTGWAFWLKVIPAGVTVGAALWLTVASQQGGAAPNWVAWVTLVSGCVSMFNVFTEPEKGARVHLFAAKAFTDLKHDARSTYEAFGGFMGEKEFLYAVRLLREKYNLLVQCTPATDPKAWEEARRRVKTGAHEADFRSHLA